MKVESDAHLNSRLAGDFDSFGEPAIQAYADAMRRQRVMAPERDYSSADLHRAVGHIMHGSRNIHGIPAEHINAATGAVPDAPGAGVYMMGGGEARSMVRLNEGAGHAF